jgi:hypothetical protein
MIGKKTYPQSEYSRGYKGKKGRVVDGQEFETIDEKHLDVPKTKSAPVPASVKGNPGYGDQNKNTKMNPTRPAQQNAYKTTGTSGAKMSGWSTRGDQKKRIKARIIQKKQYSMNQVSMAKIMKGNVNANEGAYLRRGGNGMA